MRNKYSKEFLENAVQKCTSFRQLILYLGLKEAGGNYENLKRKCVEYQIDTSHFTGQGWNIPAHPNYGNGINLEERFIKHAKRIPAYKTKDVLLNHSLKEYKCELCGISEWLGHKITLQLHHINGDPSDDRLENLQLLCPNCHSQTDTYCKRHKIRKNLSFN